MSPSFYFFLCEPINRSQITMNLTSLLDVEFYLRGRQGQIVRENWPPQLVIDLRGIRRLTTDQHIIAWRHYHYFHTSQGSIPFLSLVPYRCYIFDIFSLPGPYHIPSTKRPMLSYYPPITSPPYECMRRAHAQFTKGASEVQGKVKTKVCVADCGRSHGKDAEPEAWV